MLACIIQQSMHGLRDETIAVERHGQWTACGKTYVRSQRPVSRLKWGERETYFIMA